MLPMVNLKSIVLLIGVFCFSCGPVMAQSAHDEECETQLIRAEFSRQPNDEQNGVVTDQVKMSAANLWSSYRRGIFPWITNKNGFTTWFNPPQRGILIFDKIHISKSDREFIQREMAGATYTVTFDQAFAVVIRECRAMLRMTRKENGEIELGGEWISDEFVRYFSELFHQGHAHSVEVWRDGKLVGGLYGTFVQGTFTGESMFHKESNVTKLAFFALIERLKSQGHTFIDTQVAMGLPEKWGAENIAREDFLKQLAESQRAGRKF